MKTLRVQLIDVSKNIFNESFNMFKSNFLILRCILTVEVHVGVSGLVLPGLQGSFICAGVSSAHTDLRNLYEKKP